jgi:Rha family phage regulatory protein
MKELDGVIMPNQQGQPVTTSILIAEKFKKSHAKVLRDISKLACSPEFRQANFGLSNYIMRGKEYPMYYVTLDGFTKLVFNYHAKGAIEMSEAFIASYHRMDDELREKKTHTPVSTAELILRMAQQNLDVQKRLDEITEKQKESDKRVESLEIMRNESIQDLLTLPVSESIAPDPSLRKIVVQLVNAYAKATLIEHAKVWGELYRRLYHIYGINARARAKHAGLDKIDVCEKIGCLDKVHIIISTMIKEHNLKFFRDNNSAIQNGL